MTSEEQDAQRIALVATIASRFYCAVIAMVSANGLIDGKPFPTFESSVDDAIALVRHIEDRICGAADL